MACPYPSSDAKMKQTVESAAMWASNAVSDGRCVVIAATMRAFSNLLPPADEPPFWHGVLIW